MDKFLNNPWAVKVVALLFAFLLYFAVHSAQAPTPKKPGESFFPTSTTDEATLTDIPVKSFYDDENYVVTGVPQTVNVTIKGPTGTVKKVRQVKDFEIYADMQNLKTGRHKSRAEGQKCCRRPHSDHQSIGDNRDDRRKNDEGIPGRG